MTAETYRHRVTGEYPLSLAEVRALVDVAFGAEPDRTILDAAKVDPVEAVDAPEPGERQSVREGEPEHVDGVWRQTWIVEDLPPPPVPNVISDRQFTEILAVDGLITEDEALAWAGPGVVPAQLLAAVEMIPDDGVRFSAKMHLVGATQFLRDNVFVQMLGMMLDRDAAQLDDIWTRASAR